MGQGSPYYPPLPLCWLHPTIPYALLYLGEVGVLALIPSSTLGGVVSSPDHTYHKWKKQSWSGMRLWKVGRWVCWPHPTIYSLYLVRWGGGCVGPTQLFIPSTL